MATLGLKRQGKVWALCQGTEMVASAVGGGVRGSSGQATAPMPEQLSEMTPHYENDAECEHFRAAFSEAEQHPALDDEEKQRERRRLEAALREMAAAFATRPRRRGAFAWDAADERALDAMLLKLNDLLKLVGLSVTAYGHLG